MANQGITDFSVKFSAALQGVMRENKVRIEDVAQRSGRSKGFVSEHTSGKAAPDTDLLDVVAAVIGWSTEDLITEIAARLRPRVQWSQESVEAALEANPRLRDELGLRRAQRTPIPKVAKKSARKDPEQDGE